MAKILQKKKKKNIFDTPISNVDFTGKIENEMFYNLDCLDLHHCIKLSKFVALCLENFQSVKASSRFRVVQGVKKR